MQLRVERSQSSKSKLLGGSETTYWLRLTAEVPPAEAELLKKYGYDNHLFDGPGDLPTLREQRELQGPSRILLSELRNGVVFGCRRLARPFCAIPSAIVDEYETILGVIRAREDWGGEEILKAEY